MTEPGPGRSIALWGTLTAVLAAAAILGAFLVAPEDADQGVIQRIFYFHVSIAITSLIVIRPPTRKAVVVGLQRSLGTGIGVIAAVALAGIAGRADVVLVVLFLATAFLMMSVREVNYALFAMLAAALVVFLQRIVQGDAAETAYERLAATVIGVLIAFVVLGLVDAFGRTRRATG